MLYLFLIGVYILDKGQVIGNVPHAAADISIIIDTTDQKFGNFSFFFS